jgi:hypothetical protein
MTQPSKRDIADRFIWRDCEHVCHKRGLNPWIEKCPGCGCPNPEYDPEAVSDIDPSDHMDLGSAIGLLLGSARKPQ